MGTKRDEDFSLTTEVSELITSIDAMKLMLENTILNTDEMHDVVQTFLVGLQRRLIGVHEDIYLGSVKMKELDGISDKFEELRLLYGEDTLFYAAVLKKVKDQEKKKGRHMKLDEIIKAAHKEVEAIKDAAVQQAEMDE